MKIVVDAYGGDNAPGAIVKGAVEAVKIKNNFTLVFTGKEKEINSILDECCPSDLRGRIEILDCDDVITNDDVPTVAIRKKTNSSLVVALNKLKDDSEAKAVISAGSTGAFLTGATLRIGRIRGISRPALSPILPTVDGGKVMLLDCGANADCKPVNLVHFAVMGYNYMKAMYGIENPKVALLSNGTEDHKGKQLTLDTFPLLKDLPIINFVGNMEARDVLSGKYDVVVADGFSGNVCLKSIEGAAGTVVKLLKKSIMASGKAKFGALFMKGVFNELKDTMDYNSNGGAVFLGVNGVALKAHGSANEKTIKNAVLQAIEAVEADYVERIKSALEAVDFDSLIKAE